MAIILESFPGQTARLVKVDGVWVAVGGTIVQVASAVVHELDKVAGDQA